MIREFISNKSFNWKYGLLSDAIDKASSNISLNKVKEDEGEYPLFSAKGYYKSISSFHQENEYLAIIKDGAGIGRIYKYPGKSSVVGTMQYLIPKEGFDINFVYYFLIGVDFEKYSQGSTIPHIYFKDYKSEPFPILPLAQQKQIVATLDKAFATLEKLETIYIKKIADLEEMKKSILQKAFSGELNTLG